MKKFSLFLLFVISLPAFCKEQKFILPHDGMFYIETRPVSTFKAILLEKWEIPDVCHSEINIFAPALPVLPSQTNVSTNLLFKGNEGLKTEEIVENGVDKRKMLKLNIDTNEITSKEISLLLEYTGTLHSRTLRRSNTLRNAADLPEDQRKQYLSSSETMDYEEPNFQDWMVEQELRREKNEDTMQFANRVFTFLVERGTYAGDTPGDNSCRPSHVCKKLTTDCAGFALLFTAVMRSNDIPARTLFGRWATPQTDKYGQYHVIAEFFVNRSGWVPVDISGTIVHKPKDPNFYFGNANGKFITFHIDTDLKPVKRFRRTWAQYLLLQMKGVKLRRAENLKESKWEVQTRKLGK
jgi:hypothetical protein